MNRRHRRVSSLLLLWGLVVASWSPPAFVRAEAFTDPGPNEGWIWSPPGVAYAPILLYHHIAERMPISRYFVSPYTFEMQVRSLKEWGYTSVPVSMLVDAVRNGAELPPEPVVFTFDDAYQDVYTNAFPVLERYGFTGVVYVIAGQVGKRGYMSKSELRELVDAGWEIGSHGWSHTSLRSAEANLEKEIVDSCQTLKKMVDEPVKIFAFPYGLTSQYATGLVKEAGYRGAVGLGISYRHTRKSLYYLSRLEVRSEYDLETFAGLLPWAGVIEEVHGVDDPGMKIIDHEARGMEGE